MKLLYDSHASGPWAEPFLRLPSCGSSLGVSEASRKVKCMRETARRAKLRAGMRGAFATWTEFGALRAQKFTDNLFQRDESGSPQEMANLFQQES